MQAGGGISNGGGTLTVTNSTFSGNSANYGGGIYNETAGDTCAGTPATTIANSTFTANSAAISGGGILNGNGGMTLLFNTITANTAGGGMFSYNDPLTCTKAGSNIIAGNTSYDVGAEYTGQRFYSLGYNLIGAAGPNVDFSQEFNQTHDQVNVTNPKLGALADNGGPTQTMALLDGSPGGTFTSIWWAATAQSWPRATAWWRRVTHASPPRSNGSSRLDSRQLQR